MIKPIAGSHGKPIRCTPVEVDERRICEICGEPVPPGFILCRDHDQPCYHAAIARRPTVS